ncbi:SWIM zinc finger family protein [uncultured Nocardioides sp.]|uniref:SWIM zinc finger family protein n=1 Tax=uncultured Nocardioides sp. TaxID=198441 RepID=UPI002619702D|nr:SWIM zinc finger family protein [uncultured Nocardioides sp.]
MSGPRASTTHPAFAERRSTARPSGWWARAWLRAVEEAAYAEEELTASRRLARAGRIGGIRVEPGRLTAAVEDADGLWATAVDVPVLPDGDVDAFLEAVGAVSGRVSALLAGDLPHELVEHAEEAGVELLPYGGELAGTCTCSAWVDPCVHALALLHQVGWLLDADPFVLLHVRGLPREQLLARLHAERAPATEEQEADPDLDVAHDAAARAARFLERLESGEPGDLDHLL